MDITGYGLDVSREQFVFPCWHGGARDAVGNGVGDKNDAAIATAPNGICESWRAAGTFALHAMTGGATDFELELAIGLFLRRQGNRRFR